MGFVVLSCVGIYYLCLWAFFGVRVWFFVRGFFFSGVGWFGLVFGVFVFGLSLGGVGSFVLEFF